MKRVKARPFAQARKFVRSLKLKSQAEWIAWTKSDKKPDDIFVSPSRTYKNKGWKSLHDWLGNDNVATQLMQYRPFEKARKFARKLGFTKRDDWTDYAKSGKRPTDIPARPDNTYKKEGTWTSWEDFLGYAPKAKRKLRPFAQARKFVHSLELKSQDEWKAYIKSGKLPNDIPRAPSSVRQYKEEWKSMPDWLGNDNVATQLMQYRPFEKARKFVHKLKLKDTKKWRAYCGSGKLPRDIPSNPDKVYKNKGWKDFGDWLGTGTIAASVRSKKFLKDRIEAKILGRKVKKEIFGDKRITVREWEQAWREGKIPPELPSDIRSVYGKKRKKN